MYPHLQAQDFSFSQLPCKIAKAVKPQTIESSLISMNFWKVSRESLFFYSKILSFEIILRTSFPGYRPAFNHKWVYRGKHCGGKKKSTSTLKCLEKTVRRNKSTKNKFQKVWELEVNSGGLAHLTDFASAKHEVVGRLQQGEGQNWKGVHVQS